ncbi:hypothetical protein A3C26_04405 [Candidatus Daviesbacteria bacterium RIFCSPHIGHO2_02_FULL_39_12]|uniref:Pseudouridine synthase RsuA/RluA-like domain-containing protein n=2 Tax=Candidatus Daviesiibacteriota TaxID=1752718 RepID=A0A1F5J8T1_9BACT|nr:MAG: hypothetical protein A3C26_04405 [Candidatus Daviesbacteria bacterium RIFCSPHIGHO2_02_FULL_39_12]OGE71622.1 MAG: hypothetical protein A3H40_01275 [Candidatus Daviesbacteria bacterium RIFCSPLOWO2_02_FULL_38_15]
MQSLKIIFEDGNLLIINKPPCLVVDQASTVKEQTLADILQKDMGISLFRGGIAHRLDKDTSGLILVAKTQPALENLQAQFKERKVKKEYLALVHGIIEKGGKVEAAIARNPKNREKFTVLSTSKVDYVGTFEVSSAREAVTEYEPVNNLQFTIYNLQSIFNDLNKIQMRKLHTVHYNLFTLLRCFPKTGRTHQIRVHLKYIGHPIVSDEKYAGRKMYRLDKRWCPRIFLHAARIGFYHPQTGKWMEFESELPEDLKNVLSFLSS